MEDQELKKMWQSHSEKLSKSLELNRAIAKDLSISKTKSELRRLVVWRAIEASLFFIAFLLLVAFIGNNFPVLHFVVAGLILMVFALIGLIGSLGQIGLISTMDYSTPITVFQEKLQRLKVYSLQTLRLLFLSIPFYFAYIIIGFKALLGVDIYASAPTGWLIVNGVFSLLLLPLALWIYKSLSYRSKTNWVRRLIEDNGGRQIRSAIRFLEDIREFKGERETR